MNPLIAWGTGLAGLGILLMMPRFPMLLRRLSIVLAVAGAVMLASQMPMLATLTSTIVFAVLAAVTVMSAAATITMRSPLYSAIWFAVTLLGVGGLFIYQGAQFLGVATVVVYAGAIVVTFLFVLMLASPEGHAYYDRISWGLFPLVFGVMAGTLVVAITADDLLRAPENGPRDTQSQVAVVLHDFKDFAGRPILQPEQLASIDVRQYPGMRPMVRVSLRGELPKLGFNDERRLKELLSTEEKYPEQAASPGVIRKPAKEFDLKFVAVSALGDLTGEEHVAHLGGQLFSRHLVAVEVVGALLLVALVGAVAIVQAGRLQPVNQPAQPYSIQPHSNGANRTDEVQP